MQTFLPYSDFELCARVLDVKRLNKQIVEGKQIYDTIQHGSRWINHPAVKMWIDYEALLIEYICSMYNEWKIRYKIGLRKGKLKHKSGEEAKLIISFYSGLGIKFFSIPNWLGDERLHSSHRSALLFKNPEWYSKFGWKEESKLNYFWPC